MCCFSLCVTASSVCICEPVLKMCLNLNIFGVLKIFLTPVCVNVTVYFDM